MVDRWSWLGDPLAIDVANTVQLRGGVYADLLQTPADLLEWLAQEGLRLPEPSIPIRIDQLNLFLRARDAILALLRSATDHRAAPQSVIEAINEILVSRPGVRLLTSSGEAGDLHLLHPRDLIDDVIAKAAFNVVDLLNGPDRARLKLCPAPSCGQIYLRDRASQRWCSDNCGNRARGARHHQRTRLPT